MPALAKKVPNPIDIHVGARVRMRRMILGFSQGKIADGLGLTFQQVQKYEKGTNRISSSRLHQIAALLQVPPAFFFENAPALAGFGGVAPRGAAATASTFTTDFLSTRDGVALVSAFRRIASKDVRRAIVAMIEELTVTAR
jgi:transcriptional regulator with XRE-family HTH domain